MSAILFCFACGSHTFGMIVMCCENGRGQGWKKRRAVNCLLMHTINSLI